MSCPARPGYLTLPGRSASRCRNLPGVSPSFQGPGHGRVVFVPFMRSPAAGELLRPGGQCGGQAGQEDVEAPFEFGGAVVGG
jgi:hypothetical protein